MSDSGTRINKFLSEVGYCSRRQADALIDQGRVYVNRKPAKMGMKVSRLKYVSSPLLGQEE